MSETFPLPCFLEWASDSKFITLIIWSLLTAHLHTLHYLLLYFT